MRVSERTGRPYCFQPERLCFKAGSDLALIGERQYRLERKAVLRDGVLYISEKDLRRLLASEQSKNELCVKFCDDTEASDGAEVDVKYVLSVQEQMPVFQKGNILIVSLNGKGAEVSEREFRMISWKMEEKRTGNLYHTFWCEEFQRLNSYRLYIPSTWEDQKTKKMLVWLHGAASNEDSCFERSHNEIQYYAEKNGYLIFAPNAMVYRSNFGGNIPPSGQFSAPGYTDSCGKKQYYPAKDLQENAMVLQVLKRQLKQIMSEWCVDPGCVFLMGNSMGGIGTFYLGAELAEQFRGLIPCGALPEPKAVDWQVYGQKPILFIAGTEDHNGYEQMVRDYKFIEKQGVNIRMLTVGGGEHPDAWVKELTAVFAFCESQCKPLGIMS